MCVFSIHHEQALLFDSVPTKIYLHSQPLRLTPENCDIPPVASQGGWVVNKNGQKFSTIEKNHK